MDCPARQLLTPPACAYQGGKSPALLTDIACDEVRLLEAILRQDPASFTAKAFHNDPSVCGTWAETETGFYLLHVARRRLEYPALKRAAKSLGIERVPDAVDHFGLDRERIEKLVESRLAGA